MEQLPTTIDPVSPDATADHVRRGTRSVAIVTAGRLATHFVLLLTALVVARVMGARDYGRFAAAMAIVQILLAASQAGLPQVEMRYLAPAWRERRPSALPLGSALWLAHLLFAGVAGAIATAWLLTSKALGIGGFACVAVGLVCVGRAVLESIRSLLLAAGEVRTMVIIELGRTIGVLLTAVVAYSLFGLEGTLLALPLLYVLMIPDSLRSLRACMPVSLQQARWKSLAPHLRYGLSSAVGGFAAMVQTQFAVFAVAYWVTATEAGYLAIAVQLFAAFQGLLNAARRALMPVLSELDERGEIGRLAHWGGVTLRYGTAGICAATLGWALLGETLVRYVLTESFLPAHAAGTWMLLAALGFNCGSSATGLMYVRGRAGLASSTLVLYAVTTLAGLSQIAIGDESGAALRIARVYAFSAAFYAVMSISALWSACGLRLPLLRTLVLIAPALLAIPATAWEAPLLWRAGAALGGLALYAGLAVGTGLLPRDELRSLARQLRG